MLNIIPTLTVMDTIEEYENMINNFIKSESEYFRCNATRFSNEIYIESIKTLQKLYYEKTGHAFKLILDIPCPKDKYRVEFLGGENQLMVTKGELLHIVYNFQQLKNGNDLYIKLAPESYIKGRQIIIGDGDVVLEIVSVKEEFVECNVQYDGEIGYRKACYLGDEYCHYVEDKELCRYVNLIECLSPEYVALSFVENLSEIICFKRKLREKNKDIKIIAKIESQKALESLQDIIRESDGILIGRGDLALSSGYDKLANCQEKIINMCNNADREVFVATDIVNSLCHKAFPSRAEVCDVYGLLKQGVHNLILSGPLCRYDQYNVAVKLLRSIEENMR